MKTIYKYPVDVSRSVGVTQLTGRQFQPNFVPKSRGQCPGNNNGGLYKKW